MAVALGFGEAPAAADHSTSSYPNHIQWNICGKKCEGESLSPADALADSVQYSGRQKPLVVAVQEICSGQYARLRSRLVTNDEYQSYYYVAVDYPDASFPNCKWFGNAVFWRGGWHTDGPNRAEFSTQAGGDLSKTYPERRGRVCSKSAFGPLSGCSGHITNKDENASDGQPVKKKQLNQYMDWVAFSDACCALTWMLGDFNLSVATVQGYDTRPYGQMQESDELGTTNDRTTLDASGTTKIDYIFVPEDAQYIVHDAYIFASSYSDHRVVVGYLENR